LHLPLIQTSTDRKFPAERGRQARDALERNLVKKKKKYDWNNFFREGFLHICAA